MPWIFLCLILLNGVYFSWQLLRSSEPQAALSTQQEEGGQRLALLDERPDLLRAAEAKRRAEAEADAAAEAGALVAGPQCFTVGPFVQLGAANTFADAMRGKRLQVRVDVLKKERVDYWVFLPAFNSRAKAEERLKELRLRGIDSFIVNEAPYANAISLGHFTRKDLAEELRGRLQAEGVAAEFRELSKPGEERWVYVAPGSAAVDARPLIDGALGTVAEVRRQPAPCET